jgi:CheY-like chemotaxis protein
MTVADMELQGIRVLLVEDDGLVAMAVEDMLRDLGCEVAASASSLTQAFEKIKAGGFEFALLDVSLHGKMVFPVAEVLSDQGVPFAFASGYDTGALPETFQSRPVVVKPFQVHELSNAISAALARDL